MIGTALMCVPAGYLAKRYSSRKVLLAAISSFMSVLISHFFLLAGPLPIQATIPLLFLMEAAWEC